jgi:hypothetical protein
LCKEGSIQLSELLQYKAINWGGIDGNRNGSLNPELQAMRLSYWGKIIYDEVSCSFRNTFPRVELTPSSHFVMPLVKGPNDCSKGILDVLHRMQQYTGHQISHTGICAWIGF